MPCHAVLPAGALGLCHISASYVHGQPTLWDMLVAALTCSRKREGHGEEGPAAAEPVTGSRPA